MTTSSVAVLATIAFTVVQVTTRAGADIIDGGTGIDTASYSDSSSGINVSLADSDMSFVSLSEGSSDAQGDTLTNIENLTGSDHNDTLTGDSNNNQYQAVVVMTSSMVAATTFFMATGGAISS